jgi:hypothetical protein
MLAAPARAVVPGFAARPFPYGYTWERRYARDGRHYHGCMYRDILVETPAGDRTRRVWACP